MTISHNLAPIPVWIIENNAGETSGGAKLFTYSNLNRSLKKAVFSDAAGTLPYTNPIVFAANGTSGPFYWESDSTNPDDTYYLEAFDKNNDPLWTIPNYSPVGDGGGGGSSTSVLQINNLISNNVFLNHIDNLTSPLTVTSPVLAPANHIKFTPDQIPVIGTFGAVGPDTRFVKNNTAAIDEISFEPFTLGLDPLTGDVTPETYIRYECTNIPLGETFKAFQYPIVHGVNNLDKQVLTFTVWARVAATSLNVSVYVRQYFGSGGAPSPEVRNLQGSIALTTEWTLISFPIVVPNTAGKTLGDCGDDALYIQFEMPLGVPCNVWHTKPSLYLGTVNHFPAFQTYDEIETITAGPRTGDIRTAMNVVQNLGWVPANNGTIGSATSNATTRANIDTFPLFGTLWNAVNTLPSFVPIYTSAGALSTYGASAVDDFVANKQLSLVKTLGQVLAGTVPTPLPPQIFTVSTGTDIFTVINAVEYGTAGPVRVSTTGTLPTPLLINVNYYVIFLTNTTIQLALTIEDALAGVFMDITSAGAGVHTMSAYVESAAILVGSERHTLTIDEMPSHVHGNEFAGENALDTYSDGPSSALASEVIRDTLAAGGGEPHSNLQATTFFNLYFKL